MPAFAPHRKSRDLLRAEFGAARIFAGSLDDPALAGWTDLAAMPRDLAERARSAAPARFLERRAVARHLVAEALGMAADAVAIGHGARGAPEIVAPAGPLISLSARDDLFAIAVAPAPVGIDLEPLAFDPGAIPWNVLHSEEAALLRGLPEEARAETFLRLWTAKEAALKALGAGLADAPELMRVRLLAGGAFDAWPPACAGWSAALSLCGRRCFVSVALASRSVSAN